MTSPTIVLLPGMDGTGDLFAPFINTFNTGFKLKVISYHVDNPLDYSELESLVEMSIADDENVLLIAESFSGPIGISLAAKKLSNIKGLILCSTFACNPNDLFLLLKPLINWFPISVLQMDIISRYCFGHWYTSELGVMLQRSLRKVSPNVIRKRMASVLEVDVSKKLSLIDIPVLYLQATQDRIVPASATEFILKHCSDMRIIKIDAPHFLLQAEPNKANKVIMDFIRQFELSTN